MASPPHSSRHFVNRQLELKAQFNRKYGILNDNVLLLDDITEALQEKRKVLAESMNELAAMEQFIEDLRMRMQLTQRRMEECKAAIKLIAERLPRLLDIL
jgi:hypothetical protein